MINKYFSQILFTATIFVFFGCSETPDTLDAFDTLNEQIPEHVYIRTEDVVVKVVISAKQKAVVGEWVELSASRDISGKWKKVKLTELAEDTPWAGKPYSGYEAEIAAGLSWSTVPNQNRVFDVKTLATANSLKRSVQFSKPGVYEIWASSHYPIYGKSNVLKITVK